MRFLEDFVDLHNNRKEESCVCVCACGCLKLDKGIFSVTHDAQVRASLLDCVFSNHRKALEFHLEEPECTHIHSGVIYNWSKVDPTHVPPDGYT